MVKSAQKYSRDSRLGRNYLNRLFGKVNRRPEEQCWELEAFVINVICGIDFGGDVRHAGDVHRFNIEMGTGVGMKTQEIWEHWWENRKTGWPVVEKQGDTMVWTWFQSSRQMGDWVPLGQPCPIVYKLVAREDGKGKNKVRIEAPTPEIFRYMVFRAEKEGQDITLDGPWFQAHLGKGVRRFFGVEVDDSGATLSDAKNPVWFAEFKKSQ